MRRFARPLLYVGIVVVVLAMSKIHAAWVADPPYDYTGSFRFAWSIAFMVLLAVTAYGVGLPDLPRTPRGAFVSALAASAVAATLMSIIELVVGDALLPRFVVFGSALLLVPWYMLTVAIAHGGRVRAESAERVLVIAGVADADALRAELDESPERPAVVAGVVDPAVVGSAEAPDSWASLVRSTGATVVVLDRVAQGEDEIVAQVADMHEQGVRVRTMTLFYDEWLGKLPASELERVSLMFDIGEVHRVRYGRVKRMLDLVFGVIGMLVFLVVIPFVLLGDLLANRGPLFYRQPRVGKEGRPFEILKFRTMRQAPGGTLANEWTGEDDPRITGFGRVMRVTHLDELPQMWNILRGDLSIVGPRPEQPRYVEELTQKLPFYDLRHLVRPGLTGWAQVKYGYAGDERDALEKLQYDFYYLRHQSIAFDLRIIGRTIRSVLGRKGR